MGGGAAAADSPYLARTKSVTCFRPGNKDVARSATPHCSPNATSLGPAQCAGEYDDDDDDGEGKVRAEWSRASLSHGTVAVRPFIKVVTPTVRGKQQIIIKFWL